MILAAGRGERMGEITKNIPKPLINVRGKPLIEWHLEKLSKAGFKDIVINVCYLPEKIKDFIGDGSQWQTNVNYSKENPILETAGGIKNALQFLGKDPFAVINADIFSNFDYEKLKLINLTNSEDGHLVLVNNPEHNKNGDFGLSKNDCLALDTDILYTFSGIAVYHPRFFDKVKTGVKMKLLPLLESSVAKSMIKGELFKGIWSDIGTPERLKRINQI